MRGTMKESDEMEKMILSKDGFYYKMLEKTFGEAGAKEFWNDNEEYILACLEAECSNMLGQIYPEGIPEEEYNDLLNNLCEDRNTFDKYYISLEELKENGFKLKEVLYNQSTKNNGKLEIKDIIVLLEEGMRFFGSGFICLNSKYKTRNKTYMGFKPRNTEN
jgi:hypothetical protein